MSKNITTAWTFRDGREYVISLNVSDHPPTNPSMNLKITDKITAEEWSCNYDAKFIETITHRTGNYKDFQTFMSMMKTALLRKSEAIAVDLMTLGELETLRSQKAGGAINPPGLFTSNRNSAASMVGEDQSTMDLNREKARPQASEDSLKRRFFIMTYIAAFDRTQYPIPLNYTLPPNPQIMQNTIVLLKSEVIALRNSKAALEEEVVYLRQSQSNIDAFKTNAFFNKSLDDAMFMPMNPMDGSNNEGVVKQLHSRIEYLETKLKEEKAEHQEELNKVEMENKHLRRKLAQSQDYQDRLENELVYLKKGNHIGLGLGIRPSRSDTYFGNSQFGRGESYTRIGCRSQGRSGFGRRSQSNSPSPSRRFDPTGYWQEKRQKQELIDQMRRDKINQLRSRFRSPSTSSVDGRRQPQSRSSSTHSIPGGRAAPSRSPTRAVQSQSKLDAVAEGLNQVQQEIEEKMKGGRSLKRSRRARQHARSPVGTRIGSIGQTRSNDGLIRQRIPFQRFANKARTRL